MKKRKMSGAIRVVFDRSNLGDNPIFFTAEINNAIPTLVPAAAIPTRDTTPVISPTTFMMRGQE